MHRWGLVSQACKAFVTREKTSEIALESILVFIPLSITGLLQISPGRRMEESCLAVGYHFRPSRKHSRFPMWWKLTLESTAARPQTGWVPHTTSLKSPWKVRSHYGIRLWRKTLNAARHHWQLVWNGHKDSVDNTPFILPQRLHSGSVLRGTWSSRRMRLASWLAGSVVSPNRRLPGLSTASQ